MFQPALNLIRKECSGPVALNLVANISRYHRIRVSPGYRQAANYVLENSRLGVCRPSYCVSRSIS